MDKLNDTSSKISGGFYCDGLLVMAFGYLLERKWNLVGRT
jgi:hypothetical protein